MKHGNESNPVALVIFGVTGDLTRRKLIPALYQLCKDDQLPAPLHVVGFARRPWSDEKLREELTAGIMQFARTKPVDAQSVEELLKNAAYIQSDFQEPEGYSRLLSYLEVKGYRRVIFYLATPPDAYVEIIQNLLKSMVLEEAVIVHFFRDMG